VCAIAVNKVGRVAAPVVSFPAEANSAVTSGYSVTVSGMNFAASATTPTLTIGRSSCATAAWTSVSSVVCMLSMGEGVSHELRMTVSGVVGCCTSGFSYDGLHPSPAFLCSWWCIHLTQDCFNAVLIDSLVAAPVLSSVHLTGPDNSARSGGTTATLLGLSFGASDRTPTAAVASVICGSTSWCSSTSAVCLAVTGGVGSSESMGMTVASVVGTLTSSFSFDGVLRWRCFATCAWRALLPEQ
jgi:hypothetical protein